MEIYEILRGILYPLEVRVSPETVGVFLHGNTFVVLSQLHLKSLPWGA